MKKELKERIIKAIYNLDLKEEQLDVITLEDMKNICKLAKCEMIELMEFLRFEK